MAGVGDCPLPGWASETLMTRSWDRPFWATSVRLSPLVKVSWATPRLTTSEPSSWERKVLPPAPGLERRVLAPMPGRDPTDKELERKRGELGIHLPTRKHSPCWAKTASPPAWLRPSPKQA